MSRSYYEMRDAKVNIAHELMNRGWEVLGYKPNESDSMTDYYSPANWGGIATKNGFVLVVDNSYAAESKPIKKYNYDNCLSHADMKKIEKLQNMTVERGATAGEEENAKAMIEKIKSNTSDSPEYEIVGYTTAHMANPGKCKWHIEKDNSIFDKGTGITKYSDLPESYRFDMNTMTFKDGYKTYSTWEDGEPVSKKRELSEEELKAVNSFKSLILRWERIVNNMNTMGDGTKETEEAAIGQQENEKMEKVIVKEVKTVLKMVEVTDRKEIKVGDYLTLAHHGHYWKVTREYMQKGTWKGVKEERKAFVYEIVGKQSRGYQQLKNASRYYDFEFRMLKALESGDIKIFELKEVEEVQEVEKWVKVSNKKATSTTKKETVNTETVKENKQTQETTEIKNHEEIGQFTIAEDVDTRDNSTIYVLKLTEKVSKEEFNNIRNYIKSIGGYYSRFKGGFIFKNNPSEVLGLNQQEQIQEVAAEVETIEISENEIIDDATILNENNETIEVSNTIKPYSKDVLKYVNSICETIIEMNWEFQEIKIIDDNGEPCIWGLVKKSKGVTEWEGLYAPSYERTELQDVFNCLNSRIVKDITIDGMEEIKELSTLQEVPTDSTIDNSKLIIFIEGEGNTPELKTNDIVKATENLNDRIMKEYNCEYGGYSKTWITLTLNGNNYRFRYDVDKTMRLTTNIIKFMLEQETAEYNYTMNNINDFSWLNPEEYKKEATETIELLEKLLSENNINITIDNDPFQRALNTIEDNNLYEINADSKTVITDNRYIKNIACNGLTVVTGHTIRELLQEGRRIDIIRLKPLRMDINIFMEGIKKHDLKQIFSLFPTATDKAIENIKFMDRLQYELNRATAAV